MIEFSSSNELRGLLFCIMPLQTSKKVPLAKRVKLLLRKSITNDAKHIANCGIKKQHANNNRIERLNGTMRERVKVQRGWKTVKTILAEGQRIQYNFVKPHMALDGKTPANAAGMNITGWKNLLEASVKESKD